MAASEYTVFHLKNIINILFLPNHSQCVLNCLHLQFYFPAHIFYLQVSKKTNVIGSYNVWAIAMMKLQLTLKHNFYTSASKMIFINILRNVTNYLFK